MAMTTCMNCGRPVSANARFCAGCGKAPGAPAPGASLGGVGMPSGPAPTSMMSGLGSDLGVAPGPFSTSGAGAISSGNTIAHRLAAGETPITTLRLHHGEVTLTNKRVLIVNNIQIFFSLINVGRIDTAQRRVSVDTVEYGRRVDVGRIVIATLLLLGGLIMMMKGSFGVIIGLLFWIFTAALLWEAFPSALATRDRTGHPAGIKVRPNERAQAMEFMVWLEKELAE